MELILEIQGAEKHEAEVAMKLLQPFLDSIVREKTPSLDYFVVTDSDDKQFANTVAKYARLVGTQTNVTQDGTYFTAGKTLSALDEEGKLHQTVVIKSFIWISAAYAYACAVGNVQTDILQKHNPKYTALTTILHELGHVADGEKQYIMSGTVNTRTQYDLRYEYDEYAKQTAISLWGEYYAESFAYKIVKCDEDLTADIEENLVECIQSYSFGTASAALLDRAYRILYFFVHRLGYLHNQSKLPVGFDYGKYVNQDFITEYIPILVKTEKEITVLNSAYPNWDYKKQLKGLSSIFKELVTFEYNRQTTSNQH